MYVFILSSYEINVISTFYFINYKTRYNIQIKLKSSFLYKLMQIYIPELGFSSRDFGSKYHNLYSMVAIDKFDCSITVSKAH